MTDWDAYNADLAKGYPRQLVRLKYDVTPDAYDQLLDCFIFDFRRAWWYFWSFVRDALLVRCWICHRRHWRKPFIERTPGGGGMHCGYGIRWTLKSMWTVWYGAGKHGED